MTIIEFAILTAKPNISAGVVRNRVKQAKHLFREIELLHPQVDDGGRRPDNCEYPWADGSQTVHVPAEHDFEALKLVDKPGGLEMLKVIEQAINDLCP